MLSNWHFRRVCSFSTTFSHSWFLGILVFFLPFFSLLVILVLVVVLAVVPLFFLAIVLNSFCLPFFSRTRSRSIRLYACSYYMYMYWYIFDIILILWRIIWLPFSLKWAWNHIVPNMDTCRIKYMHWEKPNPNLNPNSHIIWMKELWICTYGYRHGKPNS